MATLFAVEQKARPNLFNTKVSRIFFTKKIQDIILMSIKHISMVT
jgi:hypothetical protein